MDKKEHFLDQVIRFGRMLDGLDELDREREEASHQLVYNLAQYVYAADLDGRAVWNMVNNCRKTGDYGAAVELATRERDSRNVAKI